MSKNKIKAKTRTEIREALTNGTLFTQVALNNRVVTFTLATEFDEPRHHRVINQVLKSLRNSSSSLKQNIYNIDNFNRHPTLTLTKAHTFTDSQAVLNALVAAQTHTALKPIDPNVHSKAALDLAFWDFLEKEGLGVELDLNAAVSSAYTSRSSSSEDFFGSLFHEINPLVFGFTHVLDQATANTLEANSKLALNTKDNQEASKENIELGYRL